MACPVAPNEPALLNLSLSQGKKQVRCARREGRNERSMIAAACGLVLALSLLSGAVGAEQNGAATAAPLAVETKIPLGDVSGRIDHLAIDVARKHLYVAELGNDSIGIVDVEARRVIRTVAGFDEPQGVAYEPATDTVYVANGGDGSVRIFSGAELAAIATIPLGKDADNVRIDAAARRVYVGYGDGALAVIDADTRRRIADIALEGHPESFQLHPDGDRIVVNVPDARQIAVLSREAGRQVAAWPTGSLRANYPLLLDVGNGRVVDVFRSPARLQAYDVRSGRASNGSEICADSDDLFADDARHRIYVICGDGSVDTLAASAAGYTRLGRFTTSAGSRTGLFVSDLDRLFVAVRASQGEPAAVWVLRPDR